MYVSYSGDPPPPNTHKITKILKYEKQYISINYKIIKNVMQQNAII